MHSPSGADYIDWAIGLAIGVWLTLVGYGVVPPPGGKRAGAEEKVARLVRFARFGGPIILVCWGAMIAIRLATGE